MLSILLEENNHIYDLPWLLNVCVNKNIANELILKDIAWGKSEISDRSDKILYW